MSERDELDVAIDSALANYAEPRPGLEQRILARISDKRAASSRRRRILLAIIAPVTASLLLFAYLFLKTPHSQRGQLAYTRSEPSPVHVAPPTESQPVPLPSVHVSRKRGNPIRMRSHAEQRPKLDIFPTPQPLSAGEQALIHFVAQAPEADRKSLVEAQQRVDEPLNISAIRIPPLKSFEQNQN